MKLNINEKKALYTFGCPNHRATVDRLQLLAAITPDPVTGELFNDLAIKLSCYSLVYLNQNPQFFSKLNKVWDILI